MKRLLLAAALVALGGCMEVEQTVSEKQIGQTVKRDTMPWNNEPLALGPKWTKGDRNSWEEQIKNRQLQSQHEFMRGRQ